MVLIHNEPFKMIVERFSRTIKQTVTRYDYLFHFFVPHRISRETHSSRVMTTGLLLRDERISRYRGPERIIIQEDSVWIERLLLLVLWRENSSPKSNRIL